MGQIRTATEKDYDAIMHVISEARSFIASYGSDQWQDGYPEPEIIHGDLDAKVGYVFEDETGIHAYCALVPGNDPHYENIEGKWLTDSDRYVTVHRLATDNSCRGKGIGSSIVEMAGNIAKANQLNTVRADTHRLNLAMQGLLKKNGFTYCGNVTYEVNFGDPVRVCYEKPLSF